MNRFYKYLPWGLKAIFFGIIGLLAGNERESGEIVYYSIFLILLSLVIYSLLYIPFFKYAEKSYSFKPKKWQWLGIFILGGLMVMYINWFILSSGDDISLINNAKWIRRLFRGVGNSIGSWDHWMKLLWASGLVIYSAIAFWVSKALQKNSATLYDFPQKI